MNSIERVRAAIDRKPVDQVPLGLYVVDHDTIEKVIGRKTLVRDKINAQIALWEGRRDEVAESYKKDTVEFYRKLDCVDIICFKEAARLPPKDYEPLRPRRIDERTWEDKHGRVWQASYDSNMITCVEDPNAKEQTYTPEMFQKPVTDVPPDPSCFEAQDYLIQELGKERYIMGGSGGTTAIVLLGGMENGLMEYALNPETVRAATAHSVALQNLHDKYNIRPGQSGVLIEQDMASTKGPMISPAMFREFCLPAMTERVAHIKSFNMQVSLHNCGNNLAILDQIADAGVQCYQSLQRFAGMELSVLKKMQGHRMAFWGGVDLEVLVTGGPEDARACVRRAMQDGAPGGGFILGPSHSIAFGTRYENFMAMIDEFNKLKTRVF